MVSRHPASMLDAATHSPALLQLLDAKVSRNVVAYLVDVVADAVDQAFSRPGPSNSRGRTLDRHVPKFTEFASRVLSNADVPMATVLLTLFYIRRAKRHLHIALEDWAHERVFLGALICAAKYSNDSTLKNAHWAACTQVFSTADVSRVEREFLDVLAFELQVREDELYPLCEALHPIAFPHQRKAARAHSPVRPAPSVKETTHRPRISHSASSSTSSSASSSSASSSSSSSSAEHSCPGLSHDSDSDAASSSPASSPLLTPPSITTTPEYPPGLAIAAKSVASSQSGPDRPKSERKRPSPFARVKSFVHNVHLHKHSTSVPASSATWI